MKRFLSTIFLLSLSLTCINAQQIKLPGGELYTGESEAGVPKGYGTMIIENSQLQLFAIITGIWDENMIKSWGKMALTINDKSAFIDLKESDHFSCDKINEFIKKIGSRHDILWDSEPISDKYSKVPKEEILSFIENTKKEAIDFADVLNQKCKIDANQKYLFSFELKSVTPSDIPELKYHLICQTIDANNMRYILNYWCPIKN